MIEVLLADGPYYSLVPRLASLTGLRAFAALGVLLLHAVGNRTNPDPLVVAPWMGRSVELGYLGVPFFFMLSGFVLCWGAREHDTALGFYRRRLARIYPLHLATGAAVALFALVTAQSLDPRVIASCALLVQAWVPDPDYYFGLNGASWSLSCEAFFYALSPFVLYRMRKLGRVGQTWVGLLVAAGMIASAGFVLFGDGVARSSAIWVSPAFNVGLFLMGVAAAAALARGWRVRLPVSVAVSILIATLVVIGLLSDQQPLPRPVSTVLAAPALLLLILVTASGDLSERRGWLARTWPVRLGEWSFALYLLSGLMFTAALKLVPAQSGVSALPVLVAAIVLCNAAAGAAHVLYERPLERLLRAKS